MSMSRADQWRGQGKYFSWRPADGGASPVVAVAPAVGGEQRVDWAVPMAARVDWAAPTEDRVAAPEPRTYPH